MISELEKYSADLQLIELNGFNFALLLFSKTIFLKNRK